MKPRRTPGRTILLGATGHASIAVMLAFVLYEQPSMLEEHSGQAILLCCIAMAILLSTTILFVKRGPAAPSLERYAAVSVVMCLGGSIASCAAYVVVMACFGGLFNPHIPIGEALIVLLIAIAGIAFLVGDFLAGLATYRLLAGPE